MWIVSNIFILFILFTLGENGNSLTSLNMGDVFKIFNGFEPNLNFAYLLGKIIINENDVKYYINTREINDVLLDRSNLSSVRSDLAIKIIIHGWAENSKKDWYKSIKDEYLSKDNYNIIYVDWEKPSSFDYILSAMNCKEVGLIIGRFLINLNDYHKIPFENMHLIGHSLGAHVAGFAAKEVEKQKVGSKIGRITGLDPAGPYFEHPPRSPAERLNNNDAKIVDVVHTDGGFFGSSNPMGTIDFYVNGGARPQPGCTSINFSSPSSLDTLVPVVFCSHVKSYLYFIESINSEKYQAVKCDSWRSYQRGDCTANERATFGANVEPEKTGNYFLTIDH